MNDPMDADANPRRLKAFAETSGGVAYSPDSIAQVDRVFEEISRDIRHGYTIGFEPGDSGQDFRRIRVEVRAPDGRRLNTRTRNGYVAPSTGENPREQ